MSIPPLQPAPNASETAAATGIPFAGDLFSSNNAKPAPAEHEKRIHKRVRARLGFSLVTKNSEGKDAKLTGYTEDISLGGASILTHVNLRVHSIVAIRIEIFSGGKAEHIVSTGKIVYQTVAAKTGGFRYGIQFMKMNANYKKILDKYIETAG